MKKISSMAVAVIIMASCSSPKYSYHFDTYAYRSAKDAAQPVAQEITQPTPLDANTLVASADEELVYVTEPAAAEKKPATTEEALATLKSFSKEEKKAFKKELRSELKTLVKAKKEGSMNTVAKGGLDGDLKLAAIFGAIGLVLLIIGGDIGIVGVIALLVGLFFLVRYLMRQ
jgi:hypothetical protein